MFRNLKQLPAPFRTVRMITTNGTNNKFQTRNHQKAELEVDVIHEIGLESPSQPRKRHIGGPIYKFNEWLRTFYWEKYKPHAHTQLSEKADQIANQPLPPQHQSFKLEADPRKHPKKFNYGWRFEYLSAFAHFHFPDFVDADHDRVSTFAHTFRHPESGVRVTLVPVIHVGHPQFWRQIDQLCSQHHSVLMEGRYANLTAPTTMIPPREMRKEIRPIEFEDSEGWEPNHMEEFYQPYSWGVADSPNHTVVHAADKYDYEKLPIWASTRYNIPILGAFQREKHCLDLVPKLVENGYSTICIPWGAAHMPIFAQMLRRNGYEFIGSCRIVTFDRVDGLVSSGYVRHFRTMLKFWSLWYNLFINLVIFIPFAFFWVYLWGNDELVSLKRRDDDVLLIDTIRGYEANMLGGPREDGTFGGCIFSAAGRGFDGMRRGPKQEGMSEGGFGQPGGMGGMGGLM